MNPVTGVKNRLKNKALVPPHALAVPNFPTEIATKKYVTIARIKKSELTLLDENIIILFLFQLNYLLFRQVYEIHGKRFCCSGKEGCLRVERYEVRY
jgi:hypothetical protein